jgi:N-acetylglutamate synthase
MNPDYFAAAMTDMRSHMNERIPGGRLLQRGGAAAWLTGAPFPHFNVVWAERPNASASAVAALLDEAAAAAVPFTLALRQGADTALADLAAARGLKHDEELPLMALDAETAAKAVRPAQGLAIRRLRADEGPLHAKVASIGFGGGPEAAFLPSDAFFELDGVRGYVGEVDGQPVATALGVTTGELTAIYSVATDPAFRRRGFGTALTARAAADGVLAGAAWCWLQASVAGYRVYRDLGFQTVEMWSHWVSTP